MVFDPSNIRQFTTTEYNLLNDLPRLSYLLDRWGWLPKTDIDFSNIVREYQAFWGLKVDGWPGPVTERSLLHPRFCGHPDRMETTVEGYKFADPKIGWSVTPTSIIEQNLLLQIFTRAWELWAKICGIIPSLQSNNPSLEDVRSAFGYIDRVYGILAWSELPPLAGRPYLEQKYDSYEPWYVNVEPGAGDSQIDLLAVAVHEIGHAIGIGHIPGDTGDIMNPYYVPNIRTPQTGDIREATDRYGPPVVKPPPPPPPEGHVSFGIQIGKVKYAVDVPRIE